MQIEVVGDVILTPDYWNCGCERNYIHPRSKLDCEFCGAVQDGQPDSRLYDVIEQVLKPAMVGRPKRRQSGVYD